MEVINEQDEDLKQTEEKLLYESCLKDIRRGAKYTETGDKFYIRGCRCSLRLADELGHWNGYEAGGGKWLKLREGMV